MKLAGQVALVTGASGGIGRAAAIALAREGALVVATGRDTTRLEQTRSALAATSPLAHRAEVCEATDPAAVAALFRAVQREPGRLDILVNAAGILETRPLGMIDAGSFERQLNTNLRAALVHMQFASRLMGIRKAGSIINIGSVMASQGGAGFAAYAAAKAGLTAASLATARELAPLGIRVNVVAPGFIDTAMSATLDDEERARRTRRISLQRFGRPEEVAAAIVFLASPDAGYITGQVLGVDGGMPA